MPARPSPWPIESIPPGGTAPNPSAVNERIEIVRALRCVHFAIVDHSADKSNAWERVNFQRLFKGSDWAGTEKGRRLEQHMRPLGVEVVYLPYTETTSSTQLREAIGG